MTRTLRAVTAAVSLALALAALPARADHGPARPPPPAHPAPPAIHPASWRGPWALGMMRREYRGLHEARERFYASWDGNPWRRHRFEAWYGARRAELDRRWYRLASPAHGRHGWDD